MFSWLTGKPKGPSEQNLRVQAQARGNRAISDARLKSEIRNLGVQYKAALAEVNTSSEKRKTNYASITSQKTEIQKEIQSIEGEIRDLEAQITNKKRSITQKKKQMTNLNEPFIQASKGNADRLNSIKREIVTRAVAINRPTVNGKYGPLYDPYEGRQEGMAEWRPSSEQSAMRMPKEKVLEIVNKYSNTSGGKRQKTLKKRK